MVKLTQSTRPISEKKVKRDWQIVDLKGKVLGRVAPEIARLLQGKHKINYVPYLDVGDYVVAINAKDIVLTGKKAKTKEYTRYSGYPGGLKKIKFENMIKKNPAEVIKHAVSGMLPKNKLRDPRLKRLYVFADEKHPYEDKFKIQNPKSKSYAKES